MILIAQKIKNEIEELESPYVIELFKEILDSARKITRVRSYTINAKGMSMELGLGNRKKVLIKIEKKEAGGYGFQSLTVY